MPLIDTGDWVAINVAQAPPSEPQGTLAFAEIYEFLSGGGAQHHYDIPVTIPFGARVQGIVICQNTNTLWQLMGHRIWFEDPDGEVQGLYLGSLNQVAPGSTMKSRTKSVYLEKEGAWVLYAELYAEIA